MNMKEVIRAAVRKELNQLEVTCHDMASVLRGLGILSGVVGQHPSSNEVSCTPFSNAFNCIEEGLNHSCTLMNIINFFTTSV